MRPRPVESSRHRGTTLFGVASVPSLPPSFVDHAGWKRVFVGAWKRPGLIHNLEAKTAVGALADAVCIRNVRDSDVCAIADSYQVLVGVASL